MDKCGRIVICGLALSHTGTMGGNSKIALELARCSARSGREVHFLLRPSSVSGARAALGPVGSSSVIWHVTPEIPEIPRHPFSSLRVALEATRSVFRELQVSVADEVFCCSDIHFESLSVWLLKKEFDFFWIASEFLFLPGPIENLIHHYKFPLVRFMLAGIYQRLTFLFLKTRADAFMITNDADRRYFQRRFQDRIFAMYGGVNVDQIPLEEVPKTRDVVFCSRLHPQKGIDGLLDIWQEVLKLCPGRRLTVIGNGAPDYETYLHRKAERLGIASSIDWLGYVNDAPKYAIYRSARVFVHPTVYDNNGMVAAEALCSGLPVVMFDLPELREVYREGCVKVPRGAKSEFAHLIVRLLSDETYSSSVRPTPAQVDALRAQWAWAPRMASFASFVARLREGRGR